MKRMMVCTLVAATAFVMSTVWGVAAEQKNANMMAGEQKGKSADAPKAQPAQRGNGAMAGEQKGKDAATTKALKKGGKDAAATKALKKGGKQDKLAPNKMDSKEVSAEVIKR